MAIQLLLDELSATLLDEVDTSLEAEDSTPNNVTAGPDKVLIRPCVDASLFGQSRTTGDDVPQPCLWSKDSGPGTVAFSSSNGEITSATFSATGTYVLRLTSTNDGVYDTASVNVIPDTDVTVTRYYVDPYYTGGSNDGSAAHPWTALPNDGTDAIWTTINAELASKHVVIYYPARQAASDTSAQVTAQVKLYRTDASTHQLIVDGRTKYQTNTTHSASATWSDNAGANQCLIQPSSGSVALGIEGNDYAHPTNYTTIRGFDVSGSGGTVFARVFMAGDFCTTEYINQREVGLDNPAMMFGPAVAPDCAEQFGNLESITFRHITINKTYGEALYIAGNYQAGFGCVSWGNTHERILLENIEINDSGYYGSQGDGVDLKAGLRNMTLRDVTVRRTRSISDAWGITSDGTYDAATVRANYLFENITLDDTRGIHVDYANGVVQRNILVYGRTDGISYIHSTDTTLHSYNFELYNNTLHNVQVALGGLSGVTSRNNILSGLANDSIVLKAGGSTTGIDSDYNLLQGSGLILDGWTEGSNTQTIPNSTTVYTNVGSNDFTLIPLSPAIDAGDDLTSTGFADDIEGTERPIGGAWDIGAFESESAAQLKMTKGLASAALGNTTALGVVKTIGSATLGDANKLSTTKLVTFTSLGTARLAMTKSLVAVVIDGEPEPSTINVPKIVGSAVIILRTPIKVPKLIGSAVLGTSRLALTKLIGGGLTMGIDPQGLTKLLTTSGLGTTRLAVTKTLLDAVIGAGRLDLTKLLLSAVIGTLPDCPDGGLGDPFTPHYRLERCKNVFVPPVGFDLTGYVITFIIRKPSGAWLEKDGEIVDSIGGVVKWVTNHDGTDFNEVGEYWHQATLVNGVKVRYSSVDTFYVNEVFN